MYLFYIYKYIGNLVTSESNSKDYEFDPCSDLLADLNQQLYYRQNSRNVRNIRPLSSCGSEATLSYSFSTAHHSHDYPIFEDD
jgi:hypothetical protein